MPRLGLVCRSLAPLRERVAQPAKPCLVVLLRDPELLLQCLLFRHMLSSCFADTDTVATLSPVLHESIKTSILKASNLRSLLQHLLHF